MHLPGRISTSFITGCSADRLRRSLIGACLLVSVLASSGCDLPQRPAMTPQLRSDDLDASVGDARNEEIPSSMRPKGAAAVESPSAPFSGPFEVWNAHYIDGEHVGYAHLVGERNADDTTPAGDEPSASPDAASDVRYVVEDHMLLRRGDATVLQRLRHESIESDTGRLKSFEATLTVGPMVTRFRGNVEAETLRVETIQTKRSTSETAWKPTNRGLLAIEQSLRRTPIVAGEERTLKMLLPIEHRVATVEMSCSGLAPVPMLDGSMRELLETNCRITLENGTATETLLWTDDSGAMQKSYTPSLRLLSFRTDRDAAVAALDADASTRSGAAIRVTGSIERPQDAIRTAFLVEPLPSRRESATEVISQAESALPPAPGQYTRPTSEGGWQILVSTTPETKLPGFTSPELEVTEADSQPSGLIDFKSGFVRKIASAAAIEGLTPRELALELTRTVGGVIESSDVVTGVAPASEVALAGVGDSTGHAMLLAALLRGNQIPARIVLGLIDDGSGEVMRYHAWTIAHVDGEWLPLDATIGGVPPANRLALATDAFADGTAADVFSSLLSRLAELRIAILRSQY